ncbi:hypothetical protein HG530_000313 [Fusarium avenaceum]|nr:hypothetical protein HG530_000313 [Fusarium avenaceum]
MGESWAGVKQFHDTLRNVDAVTQMNTLEARGVILVTNEHSTGISPHPGTTNTLQLRQQSKALNALVSKVGTTSKINIADAVAVLDQFLDTLVGNVPAVTQMHVMQILAELRDSMDGCISDVPTLCKNKIAKARCHVDDLLHSSVR